MVRVFAPQAGPVYRVKCPMAFGGRGATWLQSSTKHRQPLLWLHDAALRIGGRDTLKAKRIPRIEDTTMSKNPLTASSDGWIGAVIRFCLEQKLVVLLMVLFFVGWGVIVAPFDWDIDWLPRNPVAVDAIPDIGENQQIVFTQWMGRSPQDVEDQVTYPLTVALLGVPEVKTVRSYSLFGFSTIYVVFKDHVDFYWSRSRLLEKLNSLPAGSLPPGVQPALGPDATRSGPGVLVHPRRAWARRRTRGRVEPR